MQKIPVPAIIGLAVVAVLLLCVVMYRNINKPGGDSGDAQAITKDILKNNPKNAPQMPDNEKPAAMAVMPGRGGKH